MFAIPLKQFNYGNDKVYTSEFYGQSPMDNVVSPSKG